MKLINLFEQAEREIIIVSGNLCSGKNYFCANNFPHHKQITVSDVVRSLTNQSKRSELSNTAAFDQQIASTIISMIENDSRHDKFIIDGIRQVSIIHALSQHFGNQIKQIIWLDTPDHVARERFSSRQSEKDNQSYDDARLGDRKLGIEDVESFIRANHTVIPH